MKISVVDDDFILHGRSSPFYCRPEYYNNTAITRSRKSPASAVYNPLRYSGMSRSSSSNLKKSVSFSEDDLNSALADCQMKNSMDTADREVLELLNRSNKSSDWFTKPVHRSISPLGGATRSISPLGGATRSISPLGGATRSISPLGGAAEGLRPDYKTYNKMAEMNRLGDVYFPVTMKSSDILETTVISPKTISGPAKGLPEPGAPWRPVTPGNKKKTFHINDEKMSDLDKMYLMSKTAPVIKSSAVSPSPSPFHYEIAKLRMERLKIEEEHLLEVKRIRELERIRGPQPKWYELKGPTFHYEAHKNNELIRSHPNWQQLLDYRQQLLNATY
ncbi:uncharacterized protein LOC141914824 [Tubulanus polymorphus]|uniref:uncharacterized protein LOC141914824 n=1 Tax=Tubulanus polymorphus TaxID=672921 RepID=UPI003DA61EC3